MTTKYFTTKFLIEKDAFFIKTKLHAIISTRKKCVLV
jgi:hypothetical protein